MTIYCGVDFHARQQTVCHCDTVNGVIRCQELHHERDDVRSFYSLCWSHAADALWSRLRMASGRSNSLEVSVRT